jgi:hypothetical protein|nr:hypothetical protein [Oxalobacteraceae bacterium]
MYKHGMMTREQFEAAYLEYMNSRGYWTADYDVANEWRYYQRGRSWFAAWSDDQLPISDTLGD